MMVLPRHQVPLVDADDAVTSPALRDGDHAVNEEGIGGRDRLGHDDDQLVHVGHRRALELILSGENPVQRAAPVFQRGKQHPVPHQRGHLLMAELPPPPAGEQLSPVVHIVEAAEGF